MSITRACPIVLASLLLSLAACGGDDDGGGTTADAAPGADADPSAPDAAPGTPDAATATIKSVDCKDFPATFPRQADLPDNDYFAEFCYDETGIILVCRATNDQFNDDSLACGAARRLSVRVTPDGAAISAANGWTITASNVGNLQGDVAVTELPLDGTSVTLGLLTDTEVAYTMLLSFPSSSAFTLTSFEGN